MIHLANSIPYSQRMFDTAHTVGLPSEQECPFGVTWARGRKACGECTDHLDGAVRSACGSPEPPASSLYFSQHDELTVGVTHRVSARDCDGHRVSSPRIARGRCSRRLHPRCHHNWGVLANARTTTEGRAFQRRRRLDAPASSAQAMTPKPAVHRMLRAIVLPWLHACGDVVVIIILGCAAHT